MVFVCVWMKVTDLLSVKHLTPVKLQLFLFLALDLCGGGIRVMYVTRILLAVRRRRRHNPNLVTILLT